MARGGTSSESVARKAAQGRGATALHCLCTCLTQQMAALRAVRHPPREPVLPLFAKQLRRMAPTAAVGRSPRLSPTGRVGQTVRITPVSESI